MELKEPLLLQEECEVDVGHFYVTVRWLSSGAMGTRWNLGMT